MFIKEHGLTENAEHTDETHHICHTRLEPAECLHQIKALLRAGRQREAFVFVKQSMIHFPKEPVFLSYYGCLLVLVERRYRMGIEACQKAIKKLKTNGSFDEETLFPVFYYNLGKAYAAAGKRKEAREVLRKGLSYDPGNYDMIRELRRLGMRSKKPPIPFLQRSNPLNKYIGLMLHRKKNASNAKQRVTAR
jgi:tetratricopeptide (TPR) repeat protein